MQIIVKNNTLLYDEFKFKCTLGKKGSTSKKIEGDKKTPKGEYNLGPVYFRNDRVEKPDTKLKTFRINKQMGWCDDPNNIHYNKEIKFNKKIKAEKLYRKDKIYDIIIVINYNTRRVIRNKGSAIFIHVTNNYKPTKGCVALSLNDIEILLKIIKKNSKIKIS